MRLKTALLCATAIATALPAAARDIFVVLAGNYNQQADAEAIASGIGELLDSVGPGDSAVLIDAATGAQIARASLDDNPAYENPALRRKVIRPAFDAAVTHLRGALADHAQPIDADLPEQIYLNRTLTELGQRVAPGDRIIIAGNPVQHDLSVPGASMRFHVPSDGLIAADPAVSPFGTAGMAKRIEGGEVYLCATQNDYVNPGHQRGVLRADALIIEGFGGHPAAISADLAACFSLAAAGATQGADTLGFAPLDKRGPSYGNRPGMASFAQIELIRTLWWEYTRGKAGEDELNKWLSNKFHLSSLRFVDLQTARKMITALKAMKARERSSRAA